MTITMVVSDGLIGPFFLSHTQKHCVCSTLVIIKGFQKKYSVEVLQLDTQVFGQ